jgi:hypothetical protein
MARLNLAGVLGELEAGPVLTVFCRTPACKEAFGAAPGAAASEELGFARDGLETSRGHVARPTVFVTGPVARTEEILTHELVHAEMKSVLPYDALPTWFNEGVATYVAGEPRCDGFQPAEGFDTGALATKKEWQAHVARPGGTREAYCQSSEEIRAWVGRIGGPSAFPAALRDVMNTVAKGGAFELPARPADRGP